MNIWRILVRRIWSYLNQGCNKVLYFFKQVIYKNTLMNKKDIISFIEKINGSAEADEGTPLFILRDKRILLNRLGKNLGRDILDLTEASYEEFENFLLKHSKFIAKPIASEAGNNIKVVDFTKCNINYKDMYNYLVENKVYLLEEFITQEKSLNKIYSKAVSTIRAYTLRINDKIEVVFDQVLRVGVNDAEINNSHAIMSQINDDGVLCSYPFSRMNGRTPIIDYKHPDTGVSLKNYKVPYFSRVKNLVIEAAKLIPEVNFIGWDVAVTDSGPVIIEGNGAPYSFVDDQMFSLYYNKLGVKPFYNSLLQYYTFSKELSEEKMSYINSIMFDYSDKNDTIPDFVIILGSKNCYYKIKKAVDMYSKYENINYIATGVNCSCNGLRECDFIKQTLIELGIPEDKILLEESSRNTYQNIQTSCEVIKQKLNINNLKNIKVSVIAASFHSTRVRSVIKNLKTDGGYFSVIPVNSPNSNKENWYKSFKGFCVIKDELKKIMNDKDFKNLFPEEL